MNNLHRELAPISEAAWSQIDDEIARTFKRHIAGRRVVDVDGPHGADFSAVGTGHVKNVPSVNGNGLLVKLRDVQPVTEFRVPFKLSRPDIDSVERGSVDEDWLPAKDAAKTLAFAEDRAIFTGYAPSVIQGIQEISSNPAIKLPADVTGYPEVVAKAIAKLRLNGIDGPYRLALGIDEYTAVSGGVDNGNPVLPHIQDLIDDEIIWAPAISGGFLMTARGGDFGLYLGQDLSIGYISHTDTIVNLYLQESFTFRVLTAAAAVVLSASGRDAVSDGDE